MKLNASINEVIANIEDRIQRLGDNPEKADIVTRSHETLAALQKLQNWASTSDNIDSLDYLLNVTSGIGLTETEVNHINRVRRISEWPLPMIYNR